jgi:hypothetical protein
MENVETKFIVIEVDGEAVLKFSFPSVGNERFEMMEAILASNPVIRLVDNAEIGGNWNGTGYVKP